MSLTCFFSGGAAGNRTRRINPVDQQEHSESLRESTRADVVRPAGTSTGVDDINTGSSQLESEATEVGADSWSDN
jgi:hypothetical protein